MKPSKADRLMREIAARLVELARAEIAAIEREAAPRGKGSGHFRTVAEIRTAVARHEVEITRLRVDVDSISDAFYGRRRRKPRS